MHSSTHRAEKNPGFLARARHARGNDTTKGPRVEDKICGPFRGKPFMGQHRSGSPLLVVDGAALIARAAEQVAQSNHALAYAADIELARAIGVA